ncbi:MAG: TSUP family transporter, partial [Pseudomonadota bacterium]
MPIEIVAFLAIAFASSLVSAVFGIGTALLLLSLGALVLPVQHVIALSTVLFLAAGLTKSLLFRRSIDWALVAWVTIGSIPLAYVGGALVDDASPDFLRKA